MAKEACTHLAWYSSDGRLSDGALRLPLESVTPAKVRQLTPPADPLTTSARQPCKPCHGFPIAS